MIKGCSLCHVIAPIDVLLYYCDAFLPFLKIYYSDVYQQQQLDGDPTNRIYNTLLVSLTQKPRTPTSSRGHFIAFF